MTTFLLGQAGIPVPRTWAVEGLDAARRIVAARECAAGPLVAKPLFGSQGRGLVLVRDAGGPSAGGRGRRASTISSASSAAPGRVIAISASSSIGGQAVAAMARDAAELDHQREAGRKAGRRCRSIASLPTLAIASARGRRCGVLRRRSSCAARTARAYVLEVNSMPAWSGLQIGRRDRHRRRAGRSLLPRAPHVRPPRRSWRSLDADARRHRRGLSARLPRRAARAEGRQRPRFRRRARHDRLAISR